MPTSPVAVKLSPYFSATGEMARLLDEAGADGLVLFNRFLQPDTDPETLTVVRAASLSTAAEVRLPLTWIALLSGRVSASLAATTGVESATELTKYLLAGADVVMTASALLRHGPEHAAYCSTACANGWDARDTPRSRNCVGCSPYPSAPTRPHANAGTTSAHYGKPTAPTTAPGDEQNGPW